MPETYAMTEDQHPAIEKELDCSMLKVFFDDSPQGVLVIENGKIIYVNRNLIEHFSIVPEAVIGQNIQILADVLEPQDRDSALRKLDALFAGVAETNRERFKFVGKDGMKHVIEVIGNSINISGKTYVIAYAIEVTADEISRDTLARERKAYGIITEAALSTENISRVCQRMLEGLLDVLGFDLGTIRLFDRVEDTLNLVASVNLKESEATEIVSREDPNLLVARTARTLQPLVVPDVTLLTEPAGRMTKARGLGIRTLIFWPIIGAESQLQGVINIASKSIRPLEEEDRVFFTTVSGMFAAILERRKAEEQLKESQEQFIAFADNMPGPVFIKDHQSRVLFVNHFMKSRAPTPDNRNLTNIELFNVERAKELNEEDQKVLARGPIDRVQRVLDNDGNIRTYRSHKFPIFREGKPPLIGGFSLDITEQVEAEKQSNEARARAEWAIDLMSHDLNNMHQGIMGSLELILQNPDLSDDLRQIAENALMQVNRSVSLIANVKKFSLVDQGDIVFEKTDPANSLIAAIEILKQSFPTREIIVETNVSSGQYCIMADDFLQDVFYNILHNAVKATPTDEIRLQVDVNLIEEGEFLRLDFLDWGDGINDRMKENILTGLDERIRRISGVGLTLVKQIIDHYHGKIWVEDRVEGDYTKGTRFVVLLPHGC
jgi:PAS domain S-box-containing protein